MKNEIRIRKRRFLAAMLALLLLLNQFPPISARAAEYAAKTLSNNQILAPGDTISNSADLNSADQSCAITYYDYGETGGELLSGTIAQNSAHTVPAYNGTVPAGFEFTGWQVLYVSITSSGAVESITLEAMVAIDGTQISDSLQGTVLTAGTVIYSESDVYKITYYDQDGNSLGELQSISAYTPYSVTGYTGEVPEGSQFTGWKVSFASGGLIELTAQFALNQYTITFNTDGGSAVDAITADYGAAVTAPADPIREGYTFAGWDKEIPATMPAENVTITAQWTANKYTIEFVNADGMVLQSGEVAYGETPVYSGETPTKAATAQYTYTFASWSPVITAVTGNATYTATFTEIANQYTIEFVNEDGTVLQSSQIAYGETPVYNGETPTKAATAQYTYTFADWDAEIVPVTDNATYTATYTETVNQYTINFVNEDGTVLQRSEVAYGEMPIYNGETPAKTATVQYTYSFAGWTPEITAVTDDATYTATYTETVNQYTIEFVNADGMVLQSSEVAYGATPVYSGEIPTKAATAQYTYTFTGWTPGITAVTGDATYTAIYTETINQYTIKFVNEDGTELQSGEVAYGDTPIYNGETPAKAATAQYTYAFKGWTPEITAVAGDATYRATYTETVNQYTIKFVNEDGTELQTNEVAYGEMPSYTGETPTKTATAEHTYTFAGWTPEITSVTGDATYTAAYTAVVNQYTITFDTDGGSAVAAITADYGAAITAPAAPTREGYTFAGWDKAVPTTMPAENITITAQWTVNKYTVKFMNEDGTELQSSEVTYGETPSYTGATPTKAATAQFTYTFTGWTPAITAVTGDITYTAIYTETVNQYTIKFVNEDGTELQSSEVAYGDTPIYNGETPTKAATAQHTYTFAGWSPVITAVTGNAIYTATYTETVNQYTIKFVNEDGTQLQSSEVAYGETPVYNGITPTKAATAQFTYTFTGWTPEITAVAGDATYTATYTETVNQYTIKFVNEDGTELQSSEVAYGDTPIYNGETPAKAATAQYTYSFAGWTPAIAAVTSDATYTATFTETVNKYTIKFVNEDGTELQSGEVSYGETPVYSGETPTKGATAQYSYTFTGWTPEITAVTGDATYRATYTETVNKYTIKFINENGTELQSSEVAYGETPVYSGETPTKAATAQYTYAFAGWTPVIAAVTGDATYTAVYTQTANKYTITFNTDGGSEIASITQDYGTTVTAPAKPTKSGYMFAGWDKTIPATMPAENITITARWTANSYSIRYILNGGTNGENPGSYTYGTGVSGFANAVKPGYNFVGWYESANFGGNPVTSVAANRTGDITLYAKFEMGIISAGTYYLTAGVAYKLGNVTKVTGDSSVYTPGSIFYVSTSGTYTFS